MNFITLLTRIKNEPFIEEFVRHYLNEGIDIIHIFDDNSTIPLPEFIIHNPKVVIHKSYKFKQGDMIETNELYKKIRLTSTWFILVDADEYITTKKHLNKTIRDELQSTFKDVDCIKVPWVFMAWNNKEKEPENLLLENIYRMNHDLKHPNKWAKGRCRYASIEIKSIFKGNKYQELNHTHIPYSNKETICVNSVNSNRSPLDPYFINLREEKINNAYLICYHYRFTSNECCKRKAETSSYKVYNVDINILKSTDYPELIDETMRNKVLSRV
jgi:hypothetical protein